MVTFSDPIQVLFKDGKIGRYQRCNWLGACHFGEPTVYVIRMGVVVWVKPGESCGWIEA